MEKHQFTVNGNVLINSTKEPLTLVVNNDRIELLPYETEGKLLHDILECTEAETEIPRGTYTLIKKTYVAGPTGLKFLSQLAPNVIVLGNEVQVRSYYSRVFLPVKIESGHSPVKFEL